MESIVRKLDELGRIVLPREFRQALDLSEKSEVRIWADAENSQIVIQKEEPTCIFCGNMEDLKQLRGKSICALCQNNVTAL